MQSVPIIITSYIEYNISINSICTAYIPGKCTRLWWRIYFIDIKDITCLSRHFHIIKCYCVCKYDVWFKHMDIKYCHPYCTCTLWMQRDDGKINLYQIDMHYYYILHNIFVFEEIVNIRIMLASSYKPIFQKHSKATL
jgi:hypothetical protein